MIVRYDNRKKVILFGSKEVIYEILILDFSGNLEFVIMDLVLNIFFCVDRIIYNGDEIVYVLEGEVKFFMDDDEFILFKGDSVKVFLGIKYKW